MSLQFKSSQCTLAQLVVRNIAKVEVTPSSLKIGSLVCRSKLLFMASAVNKNSCHQTRMVKKKSDAGWSSLVARRAHNPKVVGSNPAPATNPLFLKRCDATLAQLVERNLAKVEVTSSNLVCRSNLNLRNVH